MNITRYNMLLNGRLLQEGGHYPARIVSISVQCPCIPKINIGKVSFLSAGYGSLALRVLEPPLACNPQVKGVCWELFYLYTPATDLQLLSPWTPGREGDVSLEETLDTVPYSVCCKVSPQTTGSLGSPPRRPQIHSQTKKQH